MEKLLKGIENIKQLGDDARHEWDFHNLEGIRTKIDNIMYWCKQTLIELDEKELKKIKIENLLKTKEMITTDTSKANEYPAEYNIETTNKITGVKGSANFYTNGEEKIKVYEGKDDGSEDKVLTYEEFIDNYYYEVQLLSL